MKNTRHLLEVKNLKKYFQVRTGLVRKTPLKAVDDVSFTIERGETLGIVGESGCGKTTLVRSCGWRNRPAGISSLTESRSSGRI